MTARLTIPRFFVAEQFTPHATVTLGDAAARHMRVLRMGGGETVTLLNGQGARAAGVLRTLARRSATVEVDRVEVEEPGPPVHLLVPVADKDRMLWLAEKAAELAVTSWRPVSWRRSRSVTPRGEGAGFQARVRARMASALEQSGSTWLPAAYPDATPARAVAALPEGLRLVLDTAGDPVATTLADWTGRDALAVAVGPEGGLEPGELATLQAAGFRAASLGSGTLRFETAALAAVAIARAVLASRSAQHG